VFIFQHHACAICEQALYDPLQVKLRDFCSWSPDIAGAGAAGAGGASSQHVVVPEAEQEALALCAHGAMSMFARTIEADAAPQVLQY